MDKSHIKLSYITHFYLDQSDVSAIMDLLKTYETYASDLLDQIQFLIVDDGTPLNYTIPEFNLNITWLKITDDIPWNQPGARNLGVVYAKSDKILITDLDHEFPEETLRHMVNKRECGRNCYRISRTGKITKRHPNIFFMSRARYLRVYGYDEEFSGHYGSDDYRFVKIQKYYGTRMVNLSKKYKCTDRKDVDRSKSYHSLERDLTYNTPIDSRKKRETLIYGPDGGHSKMFLNFKWKIVWNHNRQIKLKRKKRLLWKHLWHWRWLFGYR
jgi:glycosyltransferase involved in cell wall biosynthesis